MIARHGAQKLWLLRGLAWGAALLWLLPYVWMALSAFKTGADAQAHPASFWPERFSFEAYREVSQSLDIPRYFAITCAMSLAIAGLQLCSSLWAGYALGKLEFRGKKLAFGAVIACLLIPPQLTFVPVFLLLAKAGMVNSFGALVLPFGASALGIFLVRSALEHVPDELIEAARLDGASEWTIVWRIIAPLLRPTLVSLFLLSFVFHWNDYFWPLVMTTDKTVRTLPLGVALLREQGTGIRWHIVMAGNVVLSAPPLLLFALTQRQLLRALGKGAA